MHVDASFLSDTEQHARNLLSEQLSDDYAYHTLSHTEQVVKAVEEISQHVGLTEHETRIVKIAAWLHDIGYVHRYLGHEELGMEIARSFLSERGMEERLIRQVEKLIESTQLEKEPRNLLEQVLKDADLSNLAHPNALENSELIRHEWKVFCDRDFTDREWDEFNANFFEQHDYYTSYGKEVLEPRKLENLRKIRKRIKERDRQENGANLALIEMQLEKREAQVSKLKRKLKKAKKQRPDRGIETMFRTTYRTHINLSDLADNKANILLSINAIIISIIFSNAIVRIGEESIDITRWIYPMILLMGVCMATIVFAILATRPKINSGTFNREDILNKKTNLLFFGNFFDMDLDDYMWGIDQMMKDAEYLYGSMAKDIFFLGRVLARKFMLLRIAYNVFMYGMGLTLLAFLINFFLVQGSLI
ncbi:MAG: HD domain-containing protein [Bacteroidetes bacterium]|nr:MAG: HD domain-containing protein [Bacteroidota bacterium]